jgi:hypothetical protein
LLPAQCASSHDANKFQSITRVGAQRAVIVWVVEAARVDPARRFENELSRWLRATPGVIARIWVNDRFSTDTVLADVGRSNAVELGGNLIA